jgi:hypothetical protein
MNIWIAMLLNRHSRGAFLAASTSFSIRGSSEIPRVWAKTSYWVTPRVFSVTPWVQTLLVSP